MSFPVRLCIPNYRNPTDFVRQRRTSFHFTELEGHDIIAPRDGPKELQSVLVTETDSIESYLWPANPNRIARSSCADRSEKFSASVIRKSPVIRVPALFFPEICTFGAHEIVGFGSV